jgi:hypothetical protein
MAADGPSSANALCAAAGAATWAELECETVSALLSSEAGALASGVLILGLDPDLEVLVAATGTSIGTAGDVLGGTMTMSLVDAGALGDDPETDLWTGSDNDGKYALGCSNWSTAEMAEQGMTGDGSVADGWWSGGSVSCAAQRRLVCLCH